MSLALFVMILMTPEKASAPNIAEPGPRITSILEIFWTLIFALEGKAALGESEEILYPLSKIKTCGLKLVNRIGV